MARIAGVDLPRNKRAPIALTYIHGIGRTTAAKICKKVNIPENRRVQDLTEEEVGRVREEIEKAATTRWRVTFAGLRVSMSSA